MRKIILATFVASTLTFGFNVINTDVAEAGQKKCSGQQVLLNDRCGPDPNTQYGGGGYTPETVKMTVCLPNDLWRAIQRREGDTWWDFGLYYGDAKPEEVATVRTQCRKQNIAIGTVAVAYIDCPPTYRGWVHYKVTASGKVTLKRGSPFKSASHNPIR